LLAPEVVGHVRYGYDPFRSTKVICSLPKMREFRGDVRMQIVRSGHKEAVKFVTPSGVSAIIATSVSPELLRALKRKLERKLRRQGLLPTNHR